VPIPSRPGHDWVLCKTHLGGICGTDLNIVFFQQHPATMLQTFTSWPVMLGHENVAEIAEAGTAVAGFAVGDRVIVDPPFACAARRIEPQCPACCAGRPSICENFDVGSLPPTLGLGYNNFAGGSWSQYFLAHRSQLHKLPEELTDEQAIFIDPLACSLHGILEDIPARGERILVFGAGIIGLGVVGLLRALGFDVEITMTVRHAFQDRLARQMGSDHTVFWTGDREKSYHKLAELSRSRALPGKFGIYFLQGGFDRVYDCSGSARGFADAIRLLRPQGTIVIVGTPQLGLTDITCTWFREAKVLGATGRAYQVLPGETASRHNYQHIIDLLVKKRLDIKPLGLQLYPQNQFRKALLDLRQRAITGVVKAAFDFR